MRTALTHVMLKTYATRAAKPRISNPFSENSSRGDKTPATALRSVAKGAAAERRIRAELVATVKPVNVTMEPPHSILSSTSSHAPMRCMRTRHCPSSPFSIFERDAAVFDEGDHSLGRLRHRAKHAAVDALASHERARLYPRACRRRQPKSRSCRPDETNRRSSLLFLAKASAPPASMTTSASIPSCQFCCAYEMTDMRRR